MEDRVLTYKDTTATKKIFQLKKRIRAVCGGTSASKTISILVWCIDYAQSTNNKLISVVSESFPHLSGGAMLDFENIMRDRGYFDDKRWVKHPKPTYTFEGGSKIEFISVDNVGKAHGPRRDVLFLNECNNLPFNIVDQLIVRTRHLVWLDWNPTTEFWFYTDMQPNRDDIDFITLTYLDNEALDETTRKEIESHKNNKNWWTVYGEGKLGTVEGRIYPNWTIIDEVPPEAKLERRGLDYGYSNDPTAIVDIYKWNNAYIWDEILYQKGMSNKQIADVITNQPDPRVLVIPDSSEPKSNDELVSYGIPVLPANKGQGSVLQGIQYVQRQRIFVTKRSVNIIKEQRNYMWITDKNGKIINEPQDLWNHCMDAGRYAMESNKPMEHLTAEDRARQRMEAQRNILRNSR
jgi:phage terminase large subunit